MALRGIAPTRSPALSEPRREVGAEERMRREVTEKTEPSEPSVDSYIEPHRARGTSCRLLVPRSSRWRSATRRSGLAYRK